VRQRSLTPRLAVLLIGIAIVGATFTPTPASAHHEPGPCDLHRLTDETVEHFSTRQIRCAVRRFGPVPGGGRTAVCIARRESGLIPDATSLTAQYLGLYQHAAVYWDDRYVRWTRKAWELPESALEGRTNAVVTIRMVADAGGWRPAGWPRRGC
jgi:hypothetical protein